MLAVPIVVAALEPDAIPQPSRSQAKRTVRNNILRQRPTRRAVFLQALLIHRRERKEGRAEKQGVRSASRISDVRSSITRTPTSRKSSRTCRQRSHPLFNGSSSNGA